MSDPVTEEAIRRLRESLEFATPDDMANSIRESCPEVLGEVRSDFSDQPTLALAEPVHVSLNAYLACALTGLNEEQRNHIFLLSDMVNLVCSENGIELYEPRKKTDPVHHSDVPDKQVFELDRNQVLSSDIVIGLCHHPSFGAGQELDFAFGNLIPIILITPAKTKVSRMVTGIPSFQMLITYDEPEELREKLNKTLHGVRPLLEQRKVAFAKAPDYVGQRVKELRAKRGLTREQVQAAAPSVTVEFLELLEENPDRVSSPTLIQLRQIASALATTVSEIIEADPDERILANVSKWTVDQLAARAQELTKRDKSALIQRLVERLSE